MVFGTGAVLVLAPLDVVMKTHAKDFTSRAVTDTVGTYNDLLVKM